MVSDHLVAGTVAGLSACVALQPLDVLKTRLQEAPRRSLKEAIRLSPPKGLWRGLGPTLVRNVPGSGLYFVTLAQLRYLAMVGRARSPELFGWLFTGAGQPQLSVLGNLLVSASSRTIVGGVMMPLTVLKVRFESSSYPRYTSMLQAAGQVIRSEGVRGLFRGWGATAIRDAPYAGLYLAFYDPLKRLLGAESGLERKIASGLAAGGAATILTQPFDMIRARIQLQPERYQNLVQASRRIVGEEGISGLLKGAVPRIARKSLGSAITWAVYEELLPKR